MKISIITAPKSVATMRVIGDEKELKRSVVVEPMFVVKLSGSAMSVSIYFSWGWSGRRRGSPTKHPSDHFVPVRGMKVLTCRAM